MKYLVLEDHNPSMNIESPSQNPYYRILAEYQNNDFDYPQSSKSIIKKNQNLNEIPELSPNFKTKPFVMNK